jgi:hypothetical protein
MRSPSQAPKSIEAIRLCAFTLPGFTLDRPSRVVFPLSMSNPGPGKINLHQAFSDAYVGAACARLTFFL